METLTCYMCGKEVTKETRLFIARDDANNRHPLHESCKDRIPGNWRLGSGKMTTKGLVNVYSTMRNGEDYQLVEIIFSLRSAWFEKLPTLS